LSLIFISILICTVNYFHSSFAEYHQMATDEAISGLFLAGVSATSGSSGQNSRETMILSFPFANH